MFLAAYHFDGDPAVLVAGYDRMLQGFPPDAFELHACVTTDAGISVYDACPTRAEFERFRTGAEFRDAVAAAGLPLPRIEPLGEMHHVVARTSVPS
jgi:hypothetical protein